MSFSVTLCGLSFGYLLWRIRGHKRTFGEYVNKCGEQIGCLVTVAILIALTYLLR